MKNLNFNYTIFHLPGFFQGLIPQYALPVLDQNSVWITNEASSIPYISTQDIATITIKSLAINQFMNKTITLAGKRNWTSLEIVKLCEKLSGKRAQITRVPIYLLKLVTYITKLFQWTWNISERLAFTELLSVNYDLLISTNELLSFLKLNVNDLESLENYLQEYFQSIMKKLKELNYQNLSNTTIDKTNF